MALETEPGIQEEIRGVRRGGKVSAAPALFSREKLLDELDGDEALLRRMIALFHEHTPRLLDDIRSSIARRGARDLARSAHALLGSLGAFGADDARGLTFRLEGFGKLSDFKHAISTFEELEREAARISAALAELAAPLG